MLSTGNVQGCLRRLETLLRRIKYPGYVDYNGLSKGDPSAFLPIVSFTLISFSPPLAEQLTVTGLELTCKTDLRFIDTLYKVLRDIFHYKPILTKQQFLQWGFSQRKISVICDVINLVLQKHNQLMKTQQQFRPQPCVPITLPKPMNHLKKVSDGPFVVNHTENHPTFPTNTPHAEAFSSSSPGNGLTKRASCWEDKDSFLDSPEVEERLSALEAQIKSLPGLHKLSILEKRIEELQRQRHTDKNEEQVITISRESWENLMSRVLLLETKLELSNTQLKAPAPCPSCAASYSCGSMSDSSKDLELTLEGVAHMEETSEEEYVPQPAPDSDESWESARPGCKGKGRRGKGKGRGQSEGRGRTLSRGEGSRSHSRAPSRAPGRRGRQRTGALREEDRVRLAQLRAASIAEMQTALQHLSQEERDVVLQSVVTRLPGMMLDILEFRQQAPGPHLPDRGQPAWCTCLNCRHMPTQMENCV